MPNIPCCHLSNRSRTLADAAYYVALFLLKGIINDITRDGSVGRERSSSSMHRVELMFIFDVERQKVGLSVATGASVPPVKGGKSPFLRVLHRDMTIGGEILNTT